MEVDKPTFEDPTGDFERLCQGLERQYGLKDLTIDFFCLRTLPDALRDGDWTVTVSVWMDKEIIRVLPGKKESTITGWPSISAPPPWPPISVT